MQTIFVLSGAQSGFVQLPVTDVTPLPFAFMVLRVWLTLSKNASFDPFGDHAGECRPLARRTFKRPVPSEFAVKIFAGRFDTPVTFSPSGVTLGSLKDVNRFTDTTVTSPLPFAFIALIEPKVSKVIRPGRRSSPGESAVKSSRTFCDVIVKDTEGGVNV